MILGPLLLELGAHPVSAAATSGLLVLGSSGSAVLEFGLDGRVDARRAGAYAALCVAASLAGTLLVGRAVRASGRASLVVFILAAVVRALRPRVATLGVLCTLGCNIGRALHPRMDVFGVEVLAGAFVYASGDESCVHAGCRDAHLRQSGSREPCVSRWKPQSGHPVHCCVITLVPCQLRCRCA